MIVGVQATAVRMSQETVAAQGMIARFTGWQGRTPESVVADTTYGNGKFLQWLRERGITPYMRTRVSIVLDAQQDLRGRFGSLLPSSLQRRVLRLGLFQDGNVGVFPECEKVFVLRERPGAGGTGIRTL